MKEVIIRGKTVEYAESAREMRGMLSDHPRQLLAQPGSAVAICRSEYESMEEFIEKVPHVWLKERKRFIAESGLSILISHRSDNGRFSLVGGARKLCESFEETAYRELGEETGLELSDLLFLGMTSGGEDMVNIYPDGNAAEGLDALYITMVKDGTIVRPDTETIEFIWMTPFKIDEKVKEGLWHPAQEKTVKLLLDSITVLPEIYELKMKKRRYHW